MKNLYVPSSLAFLVLPVLAPAAVLIGNYPHNVLETTTTAGITNVRYKGLSFVTPNQSYTLTGVKLRMSMTAVAASPIAEIRTGMATNSVGVTVHTFTPPTFVTGSADHMYTSSGFVLDANTTYWLVVRQAATGSSLNWLGSNPGIVPTGIATHGSGLFTTNGTSFTTSTGLNTYELYVTDSNQTVSITVNLNDTVSSFAANRSIGYEVRQGTTSVQSGSLICPSSSSTQTFTLPASVTGSVDVILDGSSFLKKTTATALTGSSTTVGPVSLSNGDVDNSGEVDAADIDAVIAAFGDTSVGTTDVDVSGEVDAADIDIVIANFGSVDG